ncbi:SMI1/KNR4 family protein [Hymenobacter gummosus]|uniref:SMI1/KNR4 family protein n=1 Tax=Hymenobacter gummosus TaxID=1776032 RepID=A0A431TYE2_9BACT|nr:SMI1/KNR4 family protein [Hymenobacter gummosus]RTQ46845.1 SMI1/KNR4 family protein [Hymenobacter gummosus]
MHYLSAADLDRLEQELDVVLPAHYRAFHLTEQELIRQLREVSGEPGQDWLGVATDAAWLIEINRLYGIPKREGPLRGKFCIGNDAGGGGHFISLDDPANTVVYAISHDWYDPEEMFDEERNDYVWTHEDMMGAPNMVAFTLRTIRMWRDINERYGTE